MNISYRNKNLEEKKVVIFEKMISLVDDIADNHVDEVVICDENELEQNVKMFDQSVKITNISGGHVNGKTISKNNKIVILFTSEIVSAIGDNLKTDHENHFVINREGISAIKTLFHEFGHSKNYYENGRLVIKEFADNYADSLNEHWKILRDEYLAEMFCANMNRFFCSINWYGEFSDEIEENNFRTYANEYSQIQQGLSGVFAFQLLHNYYFIPLFQKAGFLDGSKLFVELEKVVMCSSISRILKYHVVENTNVPNEFNSLVLEKWKEFQVIDLLSNNNKIP